MMCSSLGGEERPLTSLKKRASANISPTMAEEPQQSATDILAELERRRSAVLPVIKGRE